MAGGQQIDVAIGDSGKNTIIGLRSRKIGGGGGTATRELVGSAISAATGTTNVFRFKTPTGSAISAGSGTMVATGGAQAQAQGPFAIFSESHMIAPENA